MGAAEKANLVESCLNFVHDSGIQLVSLTFDGAASNLAMCEHFGASLKDTASLKTWFFHLRSKKKEKVCISFDQALKLVRNALGT